MKGAALTAAALALAAADLHGQSLSDRVMAREGRVRMEYAARDGVCGWENNVRIGSRGSDDWESACEPGPVRVALSVRRGRVATLDAYVGGRWRARDGVVDLGEVPAGEAVVFLLEVAATATGDAAQHAVMAAAIARVADLWPRLQRLAANAGASLTARQAAVFWMAEFPGDDVADALIDVLERGDPDLGERAIFALSRHGSPRSRARLERLAEDSVADRQLRERAIFWLGQRHRDDQGYLHDLYRRLDDDELRERVLFAVSQARTDEAAAWLVRIARDGAESVVLRKRAIFWLGQTRGAVESVVALYDSLDDRELREQVVFSLSQRRDDAAVEKLIAIARDDDDARLRDRAIFWLGRSRHPRAIAFLRDLVIG